MTNEFIELTLLINLDCKIIFDEKNIVYFILSLAGNILINIY